ncbi:hotdog family protein [Caballeronia sp. LZ001]|uniref:hotdog family protein n=1 Tax=Caballeronia sp. LZ001 TaxID=3038553 RepID=UPI00285D4187|nr:hotdog family protein [Caballeronia sp. LZ001]MDR5801398.1 hotdog family protein [Caballeronia sp. LZ001]
MNRRQQFLSIGELLPHRGTMRLLDSVLDCGPETIRVLARVDRDAWYADAHGAMPAWIGIELMAQAIGAHVGLHARRKGGAARPGVLLGTQRYHANVSSFDVDACLLIDAQLVLQSDDGQGAYECAISNDDGLRLAHAVIKVYQPGDFQTFMEGSLKS